MDDAPATSGGPVSAAVSRRPPLGPMERLPHDRLVAEQRTTLGLPRRRYSLSARALFTIMDRLYGEPRTLEKFRVTHTARQPGFARRVFDRVRTARWEQDNEQWHLLILEELTGRNGRSLFIRSRVVPQVLAFAYYQLSWFMYVVRPTWSYRLNADFEDHAEHEYALLVDEHPEWEDVPYDGSFSDDFGSYDSLADLFRQIGYDERLHRLESESNLTRPRFG